ncbi:hypothetical protein KC340_g13661 [Hortaea werneckii]|nr:hypothetical protein KC342_g15753 [Hortaea werneckii]KAI7109288.1 hypothetical protein KC339_g872 [Hortaea werneckii]KAI7216382.1 hypothetical protein KC365_g13280 [Hortaea werneckii]KAI7299739.1 hypothetical protein KC340_g13661 [Hortaea werneckii]
MDDDDYPQFDNAFPSSTTTPKPSSSSSPPVPASPAATWNPAFRANAEHDDASTKPPALASSTAQDENDDDDFFDRYPDATPKKPAAAPPASADPVDDERRHSISIEHIVDVRHSTATPNDSAQGPHHEAKVEGPWTANREEGQDDEQDTEDAHSDSRAGQEQPSQHPQGGQDPETEVFRGPDESVKEQQADLESYSPQVPAEATQTLEDATEPTEHPSAQPGPELEAPESTLLEDQHPEDHYEHQGAVPEMEAAQDEEPDAPLLEDEEAPPTPGNISREPTFGMETGSSFDSPARNDDSHETAHAPIQRSFTSNFTEVPEVDRKRENTQTASIPEDPADHEEWPPAVHNDEEWPAAGDDKTFGELLDDGEARGEQNVIPRERPKSNHSGAQNWPSAEDGGEEDDFSQLLGAGTDGASPERELAQDAAAQGLEDVAAPDGAAESAAAKKEEDLAAAWSAALDDDDLLDEGTDPAKLFGDDDDLLDDSDDDFLGQGATQPQQPAAQTSSQQQSGQTSAPSTARAYTPQVAQQPASRPSPYAPNGGAFSASTPSLQNPALSRSAGTPDTGLGLFDLYNQPIPTTAANPAIQQTQQQQRPELRQAQSFADKSKGGYQSPYDLPMEVVKPRRAPAPRVSGPQGSPQVGSGGMPGPPPRSSSFGAGVPPSSSQQQQQQQQQQRPQQGTVGTPVISGPPGTVGAPPPGAVQAPPPSAGGGPPPRAPSAGSGGSRPDSSTSAGGAKGATPNTGSGFFEDLPVAPKPRVRPSAAYTPQVGSRPGTGVGTPGPPMQGQMPPPPPPASAMGPPPSRGPPMQAPPPAVQQPPTGDFGGLRQPDRMPLLPDQPFAPQQVQQQQQPPSPPAAARYSPSQQTAPVSTAPPAVNRYSPAPSAMQPPAAASRYSPAPPPPAGQIPQPKRQMSAGPPGVGMNKQLPFAPRTSSPLAWSAEKEKERERPQTPSEAAVQRIMSPPAMNGNNAPTAALSPERQASARYSPAGTGTIEQSQGHQAAPPPSTASAPPPQRPRTQSPGATMKQQPRLAMTGAERPSSAAGLSYAPAAATSPSQPTSAYHPQNIPHHQQQTHQPPTTQPTKGPILPHRRQFSRDLNFTAPQDDRSLDPLSRWKAGPIFHWSAGGAIITSFPTQTPFYAAGHGIPTLKVSSGDIKIEDTASLGLNEVLLPEGGEKFPGPLPAKAKGKKKEVLSWLGTKIEGLERKAEGVRMDFAGTEAGERVRAEEKVVLWKVVRCLVEGDGVLEGGGSGGKGTAVEEEVRKILLPALQEMGQVMDLQSPTSATTPGGGIGGAEPGVVDPTVLLQLRQALLEGQRERAVWLAEEKKLWGHAMLLASTLGPDVWKQIVQAFVRSQVKNAGSDASRSLAALYQIFAGNSEDCVDELVPPSARAGFRMVSRSDGSVSGNALEGLEKWRETLGLVVSNRTPNDGASLVALGKLLVGYGRVEAGHTCFLFARSLVKQSGADDPEAHFVLLGGSQKPSSPSASSVEGNPLGNDLDAIQLTEIYEWAYSLSAPSTASPYQPHLQPYKLLHAQMLAAHGFKTKAQAYCDHITSAFTSTTRPSPYYHPTFTNAVAELTAFLQQAPQDGKGGSLFSRPAMKNLTNKSSNWFTKFVAGEDEQGAQGEGVGGAPMGGMGGEDATPFGKLSGEFSRTESGTDLYNPMMMGGGMPSAAHAMGTPGPYTPGAPAAQAAGGRYAPSPASAFGAGIPASSPMPMQQPPAGRYAPQQTSSPAMAMGTSPQQQEGFMSQSPPTSSLGVPTAEPHPRPASTRSASGRYAPVTPSGLGTQSLAVPSGPSRAASDYGVGYGSAVNSRRGSAQDPGSQGSHEPTPSFAQEPSAYEPQAPPSQTEEQEEEPEDPFAKPPNGDLAAGTGFGGADDDAEGGGYQPPSSSYEPPASSYEPPGYQPYEPEPEAAEEEQAPQPKKKGMMDLSDDEDDREMERRAAALKQQQKSDADRQADEAFRKAAEADAARDNNNNKSSSGSGGEGKKGWLTGWFSGSGKKDQTQDLNKPIRAKLGEENSFYYDENLKKWVNKKAGPEAAQASSAAATPPPPKGGPSRVASGVGGGPPSGPPSRVGSAAGMMPPPPPPGTSRPGTSGSYAAGGGPPGSGPPSRAGTPAGEASSPAMGGPNGGGDMAASSGPPSRPPTGLSNASSLDDLLGGPPGPGAGGARKAGGTAKGKKKGAGRYVDVMAK